jgi:hypothetical protein
MQVVEILPRNYYLPFSNKGKVMVGQVAYIFTFVFILFNTGISAQDTPAVKHLFQYNNDKAIVVFVAGEFNQWSPDANPLRKKQQWHLVGSARSATGFLSVQILWLMAAGYLIQATPGKSTTVPTILTVL